MYSRNRRHCLAPSDLVAKRGVKMSKRLTSIRYGYLIAAVCMLSACASLSDLVESPQVSLNSVQLTDFSLSAQTFELGFDVSNPNRFALPVKSVKYGVQLDGLAFASGSTPGAFSVPASGDGEFSISVSLNLLQTAPKLLSIIRDGARRDIPYEVQGELGVDIPFAKAVSFSNSGEIRLKSSIF